MNPWILHLKAFYAKNKSKMSYRQAMKAAKSSYRGAKSKAADQPKKRRRRKKKSRSCS